MFKILLGILTNIRLNNDYFILPSVYLIDNDYLLLESGYIIERMMGFAMQALPVQSFLQSVLKSELKAHMRILLNQGKLKKGRDFALNAVGQLWIRYGSIMWTRLLCPIALKLPTSRLD